MKIGLLTYHSVCNFGATLQLLSTYMYLIKNNHTPVIINWIPRDLEHYYTNIVPKEQLNCQKELRKKIWNETKLCQNSKEIAEVIETEKIEAVIIGSDAVAQHHPLAERIIFPCRKIIAINHFTSDRYFPNPFWGNWVDYLKIKVPIVVMSASSQDSSYKLTPTKVIEKMKERILYYSYISVRDQWTKNMISYITGNRIIPEITPDPVFAFNQNASNLIPSKEQIYKKYKLPQKYFLISFLNNSRYSVNQKWINEFCKISKTNNIECVSLPFSHGDSFGQIQNKIHLPLSPIEWYALIKYSQGYIGNNMHPIIVCLHNNIPFFSFDTYGRTHFNGLIANDSSSKIKCILNKAGLTENRISCISLFSKIPTPQDVYYKIQNFDYKSCDKFREKYVIAYNNMMSNIIKILQA